MESELKEAIEQALVKCVETMDNNIGKSPVQFQTGLTFFSGQIMGLKHFRPFMNAEQQRIFDLLHTTVLNSRDTLADKGYVVFEDAEEKA